MEGERYESLLLKSSSNMIKVRKEFNTSLSHSVAWVRYTETGSQVVDRSCSLLQSVILCTRERPEKSWLRDHNTPGKLLHTFTTKSKDHDNCTRSCQQHETMPTAQEHTNCTRSCQKHKIRSRQLNNIKPTAQDHHANCTRSCQLHKIIMPTAQDQANCTRSSCQLHKIMPKAQNRVLPTVAHLIGCILIFNVLRWLPCPQRTAYRTSVLARCCIA